MRYVYLLFCFLVRSMSGAESMASISSTTLPFSTAINRQRPAKKSGYVRALAEPDPNSPPPSSPSFNDTVENSLGTMIVTRGRARRMALQVQKLKEKEAKERKEEVNRKIASKKAISVILRREATKAIIEKKRGPTNSKKLLPRTVLEALHERITALRWESALKVFELLREQLWYKPYSGIYIKLIVMLGKCKQPEKAHELFQAMVDEGCYVSCEAYTALLSAYSRSGLLDRAFSILEEMKSFPDCQPDVQTYSILIKSCLHIFAFDKVHYLLSDMAIQGIKPNTVTYNTLIDAYGKAKKFAEMESMLVEMLADPECEPDVWTMNSTLRAFGNIGQIETMERCYEKFQNAGLQPTVQTFNILLDSYGKAEDYEKMSAVMEYMQKYHFSWTIVTYNIVIDAFGRAGDLKQMEYLFRLMRSERIKPSCVTLCSLVKAYAQAEARHKAFIGNSIAAQQARYTVSLPSSGQQWDYIEEDPLVFAAQSYNPVISTSMGRGGRPPMPPQRPIACLIRRISSFCRPIIKDKLSKGDWQYYKYSIWSLGLSISPMIGGGNLSSPNKMRKIWKIGLSDKNC